MIAPRRTVITGMGAVTPAGVGADALWRAVADGRSVVDVLRGEEFDGLPVRIGGQVRGFDPAAVLARHEARRIAPVVQWAIAAADEALAAARFARRGHDPARVQVIVGTGSGPVDPMQAATRALDRSGARAVPISLVLHGAPDAAAALLSQRHGITGGVRAVSATCASGTVALGEGLRLIRHGYADAVLVVGMEDCLGPVNLAANANLRALAAGFEDHPAAASRPFDRGRTGFVMSAGAAAVLLEAAETGDAAGDPGRGEDVMALAELAGYGAASDAHHPSAPSPDGAGAAAAIAACLADADLTAADIDHVSAHATGTPAGDSAEIAALETVFGPRVAEIPVTATKSVLGHLLGASGLVQAIVAVYTLRGGLIPPILNLADPERPDWDLVTAPRSVRVGTVLSDSFGFGGHNAAVMLRSAGAASHETRSTP